jgi:hypothetical protein
MRKWIFAISVPIYLLLSSGVVVHLHYCMDRLAEIGLFVSNHDDVCDDCGMDMDEENDCCHDRTDVIKLKQDQTRQQHSIIAFKMISSDLPFQQIRTEEEQVCSDQSYFIAKPDDPISGRYRYRFIEVFRI